MHALMIILACALSTEPNASAIDVGRIAIGASIGATRSTPAQHFELSAGQSIHCEILLEPTRVLLNRIAPSMALRISLRAGNGKWNTLHGPQESKPAAPNLRHLSICLQI